MKNQKHIIVSVTNDLNTDQRMVKVCTTLCEMGYEVTLIGREVKDSWALELKDYQQIRFKLKFNKGPLFYINYNIKLFFFLLKSTADIYLANDLDTLLSNYLASKFKKKVLVYDSHEYFTEVPELQNRKIVKSIWEKLESWMLPNIKYVYTVCDSIASVYNKKYFPRFRVIRNLPYYEENQNVTKEQTIIYQGALNVGRGLEQLITAMPHINANLQIVGSGDIENELKKLTQELQLTNKVFFLGRKSPNELKEITKRASLGVSLELPLGLNYTYALPNKLFDYIQARIPVLVSNLPEMKKIVNHYNVGRVLSQHNPKKIAEQINEMLVSDLYNNWVDNCDVAAKDLNWENEQKKLIALFQGIE